MGKAIFRGVTEGWTMVDAILGWAEKRFGGEQMQAACVHISFKNPECGMEKTVMPRGQLEGQGRFEVSQEGSKIQQQIEGIERRSNKQ